MKEYLDLFQKEDIKHCVKDIVHPIVNIVYNEIYPYIWFICLYNVFLIFITLANLLLLSRLYNRKI
jgi:cytochrome c oxidase assembly factor CtaG